MFRRFTDWCEDSVVPVVIMVLAGYVLLLWAAVVGDRYYDRHFGCPGGTVVEVQFDPRRNAGEGEWDAVIHRANGRDIMVRIVTGDQDEFKPGDRIARFGSNTIDRWDKE